jgi:chromosome segregation protein
MRIKKLSILGFKSIMERLDIKFPSGISGVVGPNGCGKSNIVDAIRWCMGEQSPRELRGRRMEDIIFSGAGEQKPHGMAEVSITFHNGDGTFPSNYAHNSELSITRRLFRSGESEYRINNVPCRLKDIQEIFMDTGLGNRAYSVIGQGRIGTILEQRPEETRIMLEEAAGITKYRKKLEASHKKIELTQTNLQRVEDILGEVGRQMRSLKRQASKARRYKAMGEKIRDLELALYSNSYCRLKEEYGKKQKSTADLEQQKIAASTELAQLHAHLENMNLELEKKDTVLSDLRQKHLQAREKVNRKETALESLATEMRMHDEMEARLREEKEELSNRLTDFAEEKASLESKIDQTDEQAQALESEISLREQRVKSRRQVVREIKEAYEKAREGFNSGVNKEVGLQHESSYLNKMLARITDGRSRLEHEKQEAQARLEQVGKTSERKNLAREATAEKLREAEEAIEHHRMQCDELEQTKKHLEADLKSSESELNACQSRLSSLQTLTENYEGYQMGVRTIMKAKELAPRQEGRIPGLLADFIQVDPRYEQAVEAVLADKLQSIIVESQQDGQLAVAFLKEKAKGRSSFIPLKELKANRQPASKATPSASLLNHVSAQENYRGLLETLLEDTIVVENLQEALAAWNENGQDRNYVTLEGDLVTPQGIITGGKTARSNQGLLARKRKIEELRKQTDRSQKQVEQLKAKLVGIEGEIQEKKDSLGNLNEQKWTYQDEINELDKIMFRLSQELDQLEKLSKRVQGDLQERDKEEGKHKETLRKIETQLNQCREKKQAAEKYFREKETELRDSEAEFERLREDLTKIQSDSRILQEERRSLVRESERIEDYADESHERLRKIEKEISQGDERRAEWRQKTEAMKAELNELYEWLNQAAEEVSRTEQDRQAFFSRIKEEERKAEKVRGRIEALKEEISRAKMEHSEIQYKMNNLSDLVREKFNLSLQEVCSRYVDEDFAQAEVEEELERQKALRYKLGEVNLTAIQEHDALKERHEFITKQREDLLQSIESLNNAIKKINRTSLEKFEETFRAVDDKLKEIFPILFGGGKAGLRLTDENKPLAGGVLVEVQPPGKKLSHMGLLSGGEKALVAMALLFAIYMIKPSPFCLLDEVDAPLDEANIDRFNRLLKEIRKTSQIILVTHSRRTMEITDRLYGVTMEKAGVSKLVSVDVEGVRNGTSQAPPALQSVAN